MDKMLALLHNLSLQVPLSIYASVGGLIEEIVAPIPSPLVMTTAGSIAQEQGKAWVYLVFISGLAAIGKTVGAWVIYYFADKAEDIFVSRFGKLLGFSHKEVENFGKRFSNTWHDDILLIFLRAVPIFPGAPVAAVCGLIKLNIRTYIQSTFVGVWIRSVIFAYIGYFGLSQLKEGIVNAESIGKILVMLFIAIPFLYFFYKKRDHLQNTLLGKIEGKKNSK